MLNHNLLIGEWTLDSASSPFKKWDVDFIYITNESTFWKFTYSNDRYLIDSNLTITNADVLQNNKHKYNIRLIDSFHMILSDNWGNKFFYNKDDKESRTNYKNKLTDFILQDSIHQEVSGWWKLTEATYKPIQLLNYPNSINDFTIHLNKNGNATIFIQHLLDSTIEYSWKAKTNALSIGRMCIKNIEIPIYYLNHKKMVTTFDEKGIDTLTFERCKSLIR